MNAMTELNATVFVKEELMPIVQIKDPGNFGVLLEDFEALKIALTSGNETLVYAMASYIANLRGVNGVEIAHRITAEIKK